VRRRLVDLCLLAYPRDRRERDRDYLRDLALQLAETYGLRRQAMSLVRGGLRERVSVRRLVVGCLAVATLAFAASGLIGIDATHDERVEAGRLVCGDTDACAQAKRQVAARRRGGWDCAMRWRTRDGQRAAAWRCTL
jgi:hypothetical protein